MAKKWKKKLEKSKVIRIVRERDLNSSSDENSSKKESNDSIKEKRARKKIDDSL